ncbi:MAG: EamA family transporter [Oscillospiraceae bacterium]|nr:EamA family transporter [Oscillospiraceae bacterium]
MWLFYAVATALLWGAAELFYKKGARPNEKYSHLKICIWVGIVMGAHAIFTLLTKDIGYNPINLLVYLPVSLLYIISMAFSYFGMRFLEESISDPIENTSGAICSLLCVLLLGDTLSPLAIVAILVIVVGVLGVGFLENKGDTLRKKTLGKKLAIVAFCMPFVYALLDAFGSFVDIFYLDDFATTPLIGVTEATFEDVANTSYELTFAFFALCLYIFMKVKKVKFGPLFVKREDGKLSFPVTHGDKLLAAVFETAGQFTYVYALSGNGVIAAPIISSVCVVSLLLSRIFLKEKLSWKTYAFITVVIVGILLLAVAEEL